MKFIPKIRKPKLKKWSQYSRKSRRRILLASILTAAVISVALFAYYSSFAISPTTGYATVKVLDIGDDNKDVSDKAKVTVYAVDIGGLETDEISDLKFDDYKAIVDETTADKVNFYIDEAHIYKMKITYKDSVRWYNPEPRENVVMMVEETSSATLYLEDDSTLNRTYEGNTNIDYYLRFACADDKEGLMPSYLFDENDMNLIWLCFNFSRAYQDDYCKIDDYHNEKFGYNTTLCIGVSGVVVDKATYGVTFGSGKAVSYDCNNLGWFFGLEDDIIPTWMN